MILAEIGDFGRFDSPDRLLAFAGLSPTTYQSGKLASTYSRMEITRLEIPALRPLQCR
jgi:transposase